MKTQTQKINVRLLRRIQRQILKEPRQFDMGWWFTPDPEHVPNCGTAACVAGWAIALERKLSPEKARLKWCIEDFLVQEEAAKILKLTKAQANNLFFPESWPNQFKNKPRYNAKQAVARIEFFIQTKGTDAL